MTWILVLTICSAVNLTCLPPLTYTNIEYNSWSDCSLAGYKIAHNVVLTFSPETIENDKLVGRFHCIKINTI
jgi:hypothetical protein